MCTSFWGKGAVKLLVTDKALRIPQKERRHPGRSIKEKIGKLHSFSGRFHKEQCYLSRGSEIINQPRGIRTSKPP